ncbi:MAG TPA: hypothetical protein PL140_08420 [Ferrovaceae bacterium]|nr:hypothetical protein [Ferrovaceae bacterium]
MSQFNRFILIFPILLLVVAPPRIQAANSNKYKSPQQDLITNQFLGVMLTSDKFNLFSADTREAEHAKENYDLDVANFKKHIEGIKVKDWSCTVEDAFGGNLTFPINFNKKDYPDSEVNCYAHYSPGKDGTSNFGYTLEHYIIKPDQLYKSKIEKIYKGDVIKFDAIITKVNIGASVDTGSIEFNDAIIKIIKR